MVVCRKRDPEATRSLILEAAERIFLNKGFGETAMSMIARTAGVTKSLIHHHFGSKKELWDAVKHRRFTEYAEQQMALLQTATVSLDVFLDSIKAYFRFLQSHPEVVRLKSWMNIEQEVNCDSELDVGGELISHGAMMVEEGQKRGILRSDIDPRHMIIAAISMAGHWFHDREHYCMHGIFDDMGKIPELDEAYLECIMKMLKKGISP